MVFETIYTQTRRDTRFFVTDSLGAARIRALSLEAFTITSTSSEVKETRPVAEKADIIVQYPDCFTGIGKHEGQKHITLDPTVQPVIHTSRRVPLEGILPKIRGGKNFSILEAKSEYWNVQLVWQSSYLTTVNSPLGRYRFLRMPFGLRMADLEVVFQQGMNQLLEGYKGVTSSARRRSKSCELIVGHFLVGAAG